MATSLKMSEWNATRRSLLSRLKNWEDQKSWKEFFDTYWKLVYSVALKAGLTATEAEEVVQETFISVAKKIPEFQYDPARGSFKGWLLNTTRWRIADQFRKRKKDGPLRRSGATATTGTTTIEGIPDPAVDFRRIYEEEWETNLFERAVERLKHRVDARQFQIFDLYVLKKWPVSKVAKTLGVSSGRIYLTKHRLSLLVKKEIKALQKLGERGG